MFRVPADVGHSDLEVLYHFVHDDNSSNLVCCTWTTDKRTNAPLLVIAGDDSKIRIVNVIEQRLVKVSLFYHCLCSVPRLTLRRQSLVMAT